MAVIDRRAEGEVSRLSRNERVHVSGGDEASGKVLSSDD